jgi:hypothetical protein
VENGYDYVGAHSSGLVCSDDDEEQKKLMCT